MKRRPNASKKNRRNRQKRVAKLLELCADRIRGPRPIRHWWHVPVYQHGPWDVANTSLVTRMA